MRRLALPLVILALLAGFAVWWYQPVQVLKRRTRSLLTTLTLQRDDDKRARQMGVYALNGLLASQVEFEAPPTLDQATGTFERSEVESAYAWLCDQAKVTRFKLRQFHAVTVTGDQADVTCLLDALVELPASRPVDGRFECAFHWQLEHETWHLTRAAWAETGR